MSAEWQVQGARSWKVTLPCTREEAEALALMEEPLPGYDPPPVLMTSEPDPDAPDAWRLDAYCEEAPTPALVEHIRALVPSAADSPPAIEPVEDEDWVTKSQAWLTPIQAGRFHIHTAAHAGAAPAGAVAFHIEASRAFGTGHHETTSGCLELLDRLASRGERFGRIADIGTGTGLLAFAALSLWPDAAILASDIDPVSIEVTRHNMAVNGIPAGAITLAVAPGFDHPAIAAAAPFDLIIANILAGPLIALAPGFAAAAAPGATVVLAGLLANQEEALVAAFETAGFARGDRLQRGDWPTAGLVRRDMKALDRSALQS